MTNPLRKYLLPPDVFIRHWLVAHHLKKFSLGKTNNVLDVGGSLGELRKFVDGIQVTTADVAGGDVLLGPAAKLPFADNQFDLVVSIDTLEHIPGDERMEFLKELVRVAEHRVFVTAPFASKPHVRHEQKLKHQFDRQNKTLPQYLTEHLKFGLVHPRLLKQIGKEYPSAKIKLLGSVFLDSLNFKVHLFETRPGKINRILYFSKFIWNIGQNLLVPVIITRSNPKLASRVFIRIIKS